MKTPFNKVALRLALEHTVVLNAGFQGGQWLSRGSQDLVEETEQMNTIKNGVITVKKV